MDLRMGYKEKLIVTMQESRHDSCITASRIKDAIFCGKEFQWRNTPKSQHQSGQPNLEYESAPILIRAPQKRPQSMRQTQSPPLARGHLNFDGGR
jgi:hypothetical protein